MRFLMIKIGKDNHVEMTYESKIGETKKKEEVDSVEPPTKAFVASLRGLHRHLHVVTDAPSDYLATAEVRSVHLAYDKHDKRSAKLNAVRPVKNSNSPLLLNAPGIIETEEVREGSVLEGVDSSIGSIRGVFDDIDKLIEHAKAFLNGERGEEEKPARETDPGQTTIEEHISEAQRIEARKVFLEIMGDKPVNIGSSNRQLSNRIVHVFDTVEYLEAVGGRKIQGLYRYLRADDDGEPMRYIWCRVDTTGDIPKLFYNVSAEDDFDIAAHTPTLAGFNMVAILREVWDIPATKGGSKSPAGNNIAGAVNAELAGAGV